MKKILLMAMLALSTTTFAKQANDTIPASLKDVSKWITRDEVNTKGNTVTKYYAIWKGYLVTTNKTAYNKAKLCKEFGTKCTVLLIGPKVKGEFEPKRLVVK